MAPNLTLPAVGYRLPAIRPARQSGAVSTRSVKLKCPKANDSQARTHPGALSRLPAASGPAYLWVAGGPVPGAMAGGSTGSRMPLAPSVVGLTHTSFSMPCRMRLGPLWASGACGLRPDGCHPGPSGPPAHYFGGV